MPLFEYRCTDCHAQFELLIRSSQQPECPNCGKANLDKLLSAPVAHSGLPIANSCPPSSAPACGPGCCRLPN